MVGLDDLGYLNDSIILTVFSLNKILIRVLKEKLYHPSLLFILSNSHLTSYPKSNLCTPALPHFLSQKSHNLIYERKKERR